MREVGAHSAADSALLNAEVFGEDTYFALAE
jgi:hypothetical protein